MALKTCPSCKSSIGDWRPHCDCGHMFFTEREVTALREDAGELDDLIAGLEGRATKPRAARKPKRIRQRVYFNAPAPIARSKPVSRTNVSGMIKLAFALIVGLVGVIVAFQAISDHPVQVIAAMLVLIVLFGVVVRVRQE